MPEEQVYSQTNSSSAVAQNSMVLQIQKKYMPYSKTLPKNAVEIKIIGQEERPSTANKSWLSSSKALLSSPALNAIFQKDTKLINDIEENFALPSPFGNGTCLIPFKFIAETDKRLTEYATIVRPRLIRYFFDTDYEAAIERARTELGEHFNIADYAPKEVAFAQFGGFTWRWLDFGVALSLQEISVEIFNREQEKCEGQWRTATQEVELMLRSSMQELIENLAEQLKPTDQSQKRRLTNASYDKVKSFLTSFEMKNVTNDEQLSVLVQKAKEIMEGKNLESIKTSEKLKEEMAVALNELNKEVSVLVEEGRRRTIILD